MIAGPPPGSQSGFTLVEMLVAFAIFGVLLVALGGGVELGARTWAQQARFLDARERGLAASGVLEPMLAGTRAVAGNSERIALTTRMPDALGIPGLYDLAIARRGDRLLLRSRARLGETTRSFRANLDDVALIDGVRSLRISYWSGAGWRPSWSARDGLPRLVRLQLSFEQHGEAPLDLVVHPRLAEPRR